ncbi:hypothetical protein AVEN_148095-1 [Araneus ventricosus]|uniref:Uncharacterized protein n=1 Tax=Araneus ventricosus TaxID=182803 RepID=A0A4Y2VQR0_ARAVE|nr:hypothetical protein AVEN_148095-1 [Araneus ventricosus]
MLTRRVPGDVDASGHRRRLRVGSLETFTGRVPGDVDESGSGFAEGWVGWFSTHMHQNRKLMYLESVTFRSGYVWRLIPLLNSKRRGCVSEELVGMLIYQK